MPPEQTPPPMPRTQNLAIPAAIVIAGALVAGALYLGGYGHTATNPTNTKTNTAAAAAKDVPAVTASDHILGNPNAPIKIVEYTDFECPYCKAFHTTMKQVMDQYGKDGKIAWVLRNFPLQQLHPNAPKLAVAAECVAELGGNNAYWAFIDAIYVAAPINTFFDLTKMDATVKSVGVDTAKFETCYQSTKYQDKIEKEFNDAVASGGQGTPFNVLITKEGKNIPIAGAQPLSVVQQVVAAALK